LPEVQNTDASCGHVRGVGTCTVGGDHDHVGLDRAGRNFSEDLARGRIDDVDGFVEFRCDVKKTVGAKFGAMRTKRLAEVNGGGEVALVKVDDIDGGAVRAGLADAGIAVDGDVGEAGIGRDGNLVAVYSHGDLGELLARLRIDEQRGVLALVGHDEHSVGGRSGYAAASNCQG